MAEAFEEQTEKQVNALKSLNIFDKINGLKEIEYIFPQNLLNDPIRDELKNIIELQNSIELNKLQHKNYDFNKVLLPTIFSRDITQIIHQ